MRFLLIIAVCAMTLPASAQQYKLKQSSSVAGMKSETTIYVKGKRKRTESPGIMGMGAYTSIEQCDLQRTVKLNDKKKLYFIEPFAKEEVIDEDVSPTPAKTKTPVTKPTGQKGGIIHLWYIIRDTGERKKINGFTARHLWTTIKMKPEGNTCSIKDSFIIKKDGWYIDLPEFNCPVRYTSATTAPTAASKPECQDRFVSHRSGKGKLGFALTETTTMIMGNGKAEEFTTTMETVEISTAKLDSMLFEIPPGYTQTMDEADLQDKMSAADMMNQYKNYKKEDAATPEVSETKASGIIRIGVLAPRFSEEGAAASSLQQSTAGSLTSGKNEGVSVNSEEDASRLQCDYIISTEITKVKQGSKVGGLIKAIKNSNPNASSYTVEGVMTLKNTKDGSVRAQQTISGKYDGNADEAVRKAMEEATRPLMKSIK